MKRSRPPPLPPLRVTIPAVLLLFAITVGLHDLHHNTRQACRRVEEYTHQELTQRMSEQQDHLELLLNLRQPERVQEDVASLGTDPHIKIALLLDDTGRVVASTRRVEIGQEGRALHPELFRPEAEPLLQRAREHLAGSTQPTPDGEALVARYPVMVSEDSGELSSERVWMLVVWRDLSVLKKQARDQVLASVVQRSALLAVLAGLLWLFFHFVLTRRVARLVTTAQRFAARDWEARSGLTGHDELSLVGRAFDEMAERLRTTQSQLEERESHIRLLLDSAAEGIFGLDLEGRSTFVNRSALRMLGYTDAGELLGQDAHQLWHHSYADGSPYPRSECPILHALRDGTEDHGEDDLIWRKDGTWFPVERWSYPMCQGGRRVGIVSTFVDITARKRAEETQHFLIEAGTQLAELLDETRTLERVARLAIPQLGQWCLVDRVDDAGQLHRAAWVHQEPARQELLRELAELTPPDWSSPQPTVRVLGTGGPLLADEALAALRHARDSDARYPELLRRLGTRTAIALPISVRGQTLAALLLVSDTPGFQYGPHELALARELARRASVAMDNARLYRQSQEAVRLREDFLSVASHELHTPLTPLRLHLQTLQRALATSGDGVGTGRLMPKVDKALAQVRRLSRLVDDLLDVSRLTSGRLRLRLEQVDLVELTRDLAERFSEQARAAGCTLRVTTAGPTTGQWDRMRLEQVLTNLITNALKYGVGHPVDLHVTTSGGRARWSIRDQGIGIAPEDLERIFGRFERAVSTRQYGGLGLGLYISREIARAFGGDIHVESQPGAGAVFTLELPLEPAREAREGEERSPRETARPEPPSAVHGP
ncbi:PAS domain S-box-containing protein [Archangium gephyra]|uniref:histidine kinase n=1 Tax=Archangium gephyra TaxID=48 RepID=A0AAC8Q5X1_9BACT|nr:ATP-binding protein [Archangium gephyra]AKJ00923.1 Sensory box histidine kinase [Archangium gephyra]REG26090.1 PAS domain S-box-containing protein [Archangium gephyra]